MTSPDNIVELEDLARRYDAQVLREYLLEQETGVDHRNGLGLGLGLRAAGAPDPTRPPTIPQLLDLRPKNVRRLKALLVLNFFAYWGLVAYCCWSYSLRVDEYGLKAMPSLEAGLWAVLILGTQASLEFAVAACLTQPARRNDAQTSGFRGWDLLAWLTGLGARSAILLDAQLLPLMRQGSKLLFVLSASVFCFSIGLFVFGIQLRMMLGLFCSCDRFSYDKPDLFFKGRDARGVTDGVAISARPPGAQDEEEPSELSQQVGHPPNPGIIKVANSAHLSDLYLMHSVLAQMYIPIGCQETQEFVVSVASFSRCFCEDVVQCSVKFFFLMDCEMNALVLLSLLFSAMQAYASCLYSSTSLMDVRPDEESTD
mmetsp:Transcript_45101/g.104500  ORF Transcript_45101/g.104500 Transcript_45101/m.104500 type:complete len:370 (-) Transcript_45101:101-1210(-)